jgi:hypothetical protein
MFHALMTDSRYCVEFQFGGLATTTVRAVPFHVAKVIHLRSEEASVVSHAGEVAQPIVDVGITAIDALSQGVCTFENVVDQLLELRFTTGEEGFAAHDFFSRLESNHAARRFKALPVLSQIAS